jgi:hypothetical protein
LRELELLIFSNHLTHHELSAPPTPIDTLQPPLSTTNFLLAAKNMTPTDSPIPRWLCPAACDVPSRRHLVILRRAEAHVKEMEDRIILIQTEPGHGRALTKEEESFVRKRLELVEGNLEELWEFLNRHREHGQGTPLNTSVSFLHIKVWKYKELLDGKGGKLSHLFYFVFRSEIFVLTCEKGWLGPNKT